MTDENPENQEESPAEAAGNPLAEECAQLKEKLLYAAAEMDNTRKRLQREIDDTRKYAISNFAADLVNVVENLQRAVANIPAEEHHSPAFNAIAKGVDMTLADLLKTLERYHIKPIAPEQGDPFDHNLHQAVAQIESNDAPPGMVLQVISAGYQIHDRLLKPAMVVVAKAPGAAAAQNTVDTSA